VPLERVPGARNRVCGGINQRAVVRGKKFRGFIQNEGILTGSYMGETKKFFSFFFFVFVVGL